MTRNPAMPPPDAVDLAVEEFLSAHRDGGPYPTATALARRFGVNRTTFYRHYAESIKAMLDAAEQQNTDKLHRRRPKPVSDENTAVLERLRRENSDLRKHVEIYEEHIRMLTMENNRLRRELESAAGVSHIGNPRLQGRPR